MEDSHLWSLCAKIKVSKSFNKLGPRGGFHLSHTSPTYYGIR